MLLVFTPAFSQEPLDQAALVNLEKAMKGAEDILLLKLPAVTKLEKTQTRCGDYIIADSREESDGTSSGPTISVHVQVQGSSAAVQMKIGILRSKISPQTTTQPISPRAKFLWGKKDLTEKVLLVLSQADYDEAKLCLQ